METKQTAVEYLTNELYSYLAEEYLSLTIWDEISEKVTKAKAMEKEQIKDAWLSGQDDGATICTPNQHYPDEDYYNETYGN